MGKFDFQQAKHTVTYSAEYLKCIFRKWKYVVIFFFTLLQQGCGGAVAHRPLLSDNLYTCFKSDNKTFYYVDAGSQCRSGDHEAFPCYRIDGSVFGVQRGDSNYIQSCQKMGGTPIAPNQVTP